MIIYQTIKVNRRCQFISVAMLILLISHCSIFAEGRFRVGASPMGIGCADFNKDGNIDIVTANCDSDYGHSISILLGKGDGTFHTTVEYEAGCALYLLTVADFDNDGDDDVAVTSHVRSREVLIFLNDGDGTFSEPLRYLAEHPPMGIGNGDFNGDGKIDLAVAEMSYPDEEPPGDTILILNGQGDGTFSYGARSPVGILPWVLTVNDFNNDGITDIASYSAGHYKYERSSRISILLGKGDGTFEAEKKREVQWGGVYELTSGDFNRDGKVDIACSDFGEQCISIFQGQGDGTLGSEIRYGSLNYPQGILSLDFNKDDKLDLAVVDSKNRCCYVYPGNGDGTFMGTIAYPFGEGLVYVGARHVASGDFNNDGMPDLAITDDWNQNSFVYVILNNLTPGPVPTGIITPAPTVLPPTPAPTPFEIKVSSERVSAGDPFTLAIHYENMGMITFPCDYYVVAIRPKGKAASIVGYNKLKNGVFPILRNKPSNSVDVVLLNIKALPALPIGEYTIMAGLIMTGDIVREDKAVRLAKKTVTVVGSEKGILRRVLAGRMADRMNRWLTQWGKRK